MSAMPSETSAFAIDLDEKRSGRLIEQALRARVDVSLWPNTQPDDSPVTGQFAGRTDDGLLVDPCYPMESLKLPLISQYCEASFRLDDSRFMFCTTVLDVTTAGGAWRLEVAQPITLQVVQRRRYQRRGLRNPTTVRISHPGHEAGAPLEAALLNIGTGGMACRTNPTVADAVAIDAAIDLHFALPDGGEPFELIGHTRGKTRGAQPGHVILAVEFAPSHTQRDEIERLSEALYGPVPALIRG